MSQNDAVPLPHRTVVRHEKHRPSDVKTRRRQFPPIAMYSKFCPAKRASPPWGAQAPGGYSYNINYIYTYLLFFFLCITAVIY